MKPIGHHSIVVGVDGSPASNAALDWAVAESTRRRLPLHLFCARGREMILDASMLSAPGMVEAIIREVRERADQLLEATTIRARDVSPDLTITVENSRDTPAASLIALSSRADTVVLGHRGHGVIPGALLGSVSLQVATHARCPVVVVHEPTPSAPTAHGIVVGVDGSAVSVEALGYAFEEASSRGVPLEVVHAWWTTVSVGLTEEIRTAQVAQQQLTLSESLVGWSERFPDVTVGEHLPRGPAVLALVEQAKHAELLVVGSRGLGGFGRLLLGSVSHGVLQHARCPVAVVRSGNDDRSG